MLKKMKFKKISLRFYHSKTQKKKKKKISILKYLQKIKIRYIKFNFHICKKKFIIKIQLTHSLSSEIIPTKLIIKLIQNIIIKKFQNQ